MIRLAVVDVDGCLTAGEGQPFDFLALQYIAGLNRKSRTNHKQFAVTLCTGRQEPYVEAMMQAIDAYMPAIFENGGGLYFPSSYHFAVNPAFTQAQHAKLEEIRRVLRCDIVEPGIGQFQPGKEVTVTLYPARPGITLAQLAERAQQVLAEKLVGFQVIASVTSVEILPEGIDKGSGVEWLSRETNIPLSEIAGIGDAPNDLAFLRRVGLAAAPSNATDEVKRQVDYVSLSHTSKGVLDILWKWKEQYNCEVRARAA